MGNSGAAWYLLNRSRFERELREEMEAHRDMKGESVPDSATPSGCADVVDTAFYRG
jgi:hypothetical protein